MGGGGVIQWIKSYQYWSYCPILFLCLGQILVVGPPHFKGMARFSRGLSAQLSVWRGLKFAEAIVLAARSGWYILYIGIVVCIGPKYLMNMKKSIYKG